MERENAQKAGTPGGAGGYMTGGGIKLFICHYNLTRAAA
jgi:hypothetical protein